MSSFFSWLLLVLILFLCGFFLLADFSVPFLNWLQKKLGIPRNVKTGKESIIGKQCVALGAFELGGSRELNGRVQLDGTSWLARSADPVAKISPKQKLKIVEVNGNTVIVEPVDELENES